MRSPLAPLAAAAGALVDDTRAGVTLLRGDALHAPPIDKRVRRVFWGPGLVAALLRSAWRDADLRKRYLRVMVPQTLLTLAVGVFVVVVVDGATISLGKGGLLAQAHHGFASALAFAASLYGTLSVVEWFTIALFREHHDALSHDVAVLAGVPSDVLPEGAEGATATDAVTRLQPRIRVDVEWLIETFKRRARAALIMLVTLTPLAFVLGLVLGPLLHAAFGAVNHDKLADAALAVVPNLVAFVGGAYWLGVFTLGKTGHAYRDVVTLDPFFLRAGDRVVRAAPRLFAPLRWYLGVVRRVLGVVGRPAFVAESAPWEALGLVVCRVVLSLPAVYTIIRPVLPVASTVIIGVRAPATLEGLKLAHMAARLAHEPPR